MSDSVFPKSGAMVAISGKSARELIGLEPGLTKRELFAAMAMQSVLVKYSIETSSGARDMARSSVICADALLAELSPLGAKGEGSAK